MHVVSNPLVVDRYLDSPVKIIMRDGEFLGDPVALAPPPIESRPPATIPADRPKIYRNGVQERMARDHLSRRFPPLLTYNAR